MAASQRALPPWLEERPPVDPAGGLSRERRRAGYIAKTLHGIADMLRYEVFAEALTRRPGLLQRLDPRIKVLTILILIGAAGLLQHVSSLVLFNLWMFWLARASRLPLAVFAKRVWIVVPLFTGIVVLPILFNLVQPGTPLIVLLHLDHPLHLGPLTVPAEVAVTRQGSVAALRLVLRVGASVSLAVLLTLTTRWHALLKALGVLRVPMVFLVVLEMTYRYIFLLLQTSAEMFMARRSRMVGRVRGREARGLVASAMGHLWSKTQATSEEVHNAMLARGFSGQPRILLSFRMKPSDWLWAVLAVLIAVLFVGGDRILG